MASALPLPPRKLPVWFTVAACYAMVLRNLGELVRISWLWLLIMIPAYAAADWLVWLWPTKADLVIGLLPNIIELPFLASIAVAWHRFVLGREMVDGWAYLRLDGTVGWYGLLLLAFLLLTYAPAVYVLSLSGEGDDWFAILLPFGALLAIPAIVLFLLPRAGLILPATALNENLSLTEAWRVTRGNTWRLALATLLCGLPPLLFGGALYWNFERQPRASSVAWGTIGSLADALLVTVGVTLLSLAYRHFIQHSDGNPAPPA